MAFTTEQLTALETAIASGQLSVRFNNREIRYQSTNEMILLRDRMRGELGISQVDQRQRATRLSFTTSKGL
jgi:hypothetical protein